VLAWGQDPFAPDVMGTSFAAPRIAAMVAVARAWLLQVAANIDRAAGRPFGVPLVGVAIVDRGFAGEPEYAPPADRAALPVLPATGAVGSLPDVAEQLVAPGLARVVVESAARATSTAAGLSAPSLTAERFLAYLDGLTAAQLLSLLGSEAASDGEPLFAPGTAAKLDTIVKASMPLWQWDSATSTGRMRHELGAVT
jgi:hypothetical protein